MATIDPRRDRSVYLQVADVIRNDIMNGPLRPGDNLPSEASLGQTLGVGREAIRQALGVLRGEGLIVTERGFGSRVRIPPVRTKMKLKRGESVTSRMPTEPERRAMGMDEGVPYLVLTRADGTVDLVIGDTVDLVP